MLAVADVIRRIFPFTSPLKDFLYIKVIGNELSLTFSDFSEFIVCCCVCVLEQILKSSVFYFGILKLSLNFTAPKIRPSKEARRKQNKGKER